MAKKDKIAVFGGTFNPVHNGHVKLLKTVDEAMDFKKFLIVPSAVPPHKQAAYAEWNNLSYPITERIHREILSLPINSVLTEDEVAYVIQMVNSFNVGS